MLSKDRSKTTSGFFVIPLFGQLWEEKNYCERRNELSSWRPVTLTNRHIHLCLSKLGYDVHALLSSVMYILSGENLTAVYSIIRRWWDQNTTQVANRLNLAQATYVWLLHLTPCQQRSSSLFTPHRQTSQTVPSSSLTGHQTGSCCCCSCRQPVTPPQGSSWSMPSCIWSCPTQHTDDGFAALLAVRATLASQNVANYNIF